MDFENFFIVSGLGLLIVAAHFEIFETNRCRLIDLITSPNSDILKKDDIDRFKTFRIVRPNEFLFGSDVQLILVEAVRYRSIKIIKHIIQQYDWTIKDNAMIVCFTIDFWSRYGSDFSQELQLLFDNGACVFADDYNSLFAAVEYSNVKAASMLLQHKRSLLYHAVPKSVYSALHYGDYKMAWLLAHYQTLDTCIGLHHLCLPQYVLLWILSANPDYPCDDEISEKKKMLLIENVHASMLK